LWAGLGVVLAGVLADVDLLSYFFGPSAFLTWRYTFTHSLPGALLIAATCALLFSKFQPKGSFFSAKKDAAKESLTSLAPAMLIAALLHVALDFAGLQGITLLWPVNQNLYALDWLPQIDPWICIILLFGLLLPELFHLVGSEIGTKDKTPRGRNGARIAFAMLIVYTGVRATLHQNAVAQLDAHSYRGESPHRVAAFADALSLETWHGFAETTSSVCTTDVPALSGTRFDPERAACVHKPEDSPALTAAQHTPATQLFLRASRFPKASLDATEDGTEVVIRDVRGTALNLAGAWTAVQIFEDRKNKVVQQTIVWASEVRLR